MQVNGNALAVLRHGQPANRVHPKDRPAYPLQHDPGLTELGHLQAARSATLLSCLFPAQSFTVISSPFLACLQTAAQLSDCVLVDSRLGDFLNPIAYSEQIGPLTCELEHFSAPCALEFTHRTPMVYPESYSSFRERTLECFTEHSVRSTVFVTHFFGLEVLSSLLAGETLGLTDDGYCAITVAGAEGTDYTMHLQADHTHAPQYLKKN